MDETQFIQFAREFCFGHVGVVASPIMLIGLVVGLVIAIFQALTSIQEMSLTFCTEDSCGLCFVNYLVAFHVWNDVEVYGRYCR